MYASPFLIPVKFKSEMLFYCRRLCVRLFIVRHDVSTSECKHVSSTMIDLHFISRCIVSLFFFYVLFLFHGGKNVTLYHNRNPQRLSEITNGRFGEL